MSLTGQNECMHRYKGESYHLYSNSLLIYVQYFTVVVKHITIIQHFVFSHDTDISYSMKAQCYLIGALSWTFFYYQILRPSLEGPVTKFKTFVISVFRV